MYLEDQIEQVLKDDEQIQSTLVEIEELVKALLEQEREQLTDQIQLLISSIGEGMESDMLETAAVMDPEKLVFQDHSTIRDRNRRLELDYDSGMMDKNNHIWNQLSPTVLSRAPSMRNLIQQTSEKLLHDLAKGLQEKRLSCNIPNKNKLNKKNILHQTYLVK